MSIVLTQAERIAISRRMVKIPIESSGFDDSVVVVTANEAIYKSVDDGNKKFFDHWNDVFGQYDDELAILGSAASDRFVEADFNDGVSIEFAGNYFYPVRGVPGSPEDADTINTYLIPLITSVVSGVAYDWRGVIPATLSGGEDQTVRDFHALLDICYTGIDIGVANSTIPAPSPGNDYAGGATLKITAADTPLAALGGYIIVDDTLNAAGYVVQITGGTMTGTLSVRAVCGSGTCRAGTAVIVRQELGFWSNAERNDLPNATPHKHVAAAVSAYSISEGEASGTWDLELDAEDAVIVTNEDDRATQAAENLAARANIVTTKAAITAWDALPNTDAGGLSKFNNAGITAMIAASAARITQLTSRLAQITAAAGTLVDDGDGTYSGTPGYVYNRYDLLDKRINRQYGSLRRYYNQSKTKAFMQNLSDANTTLECYYETVMVTSRLSEDADGTSQIYVDDTTGFSLGAVCYVYDELIGAELSGLILGINPADGAVQLSFDVPITYTRDGLARLYVIL